MDKGSRMQSGGKDTNQNKRSGGLPRLLGQLWGTNNTGDVLTAFRYIFTRRSELVQGPVLDEYERAFARKVGTRHAISFSSGRVALYALLSELGIGPGDEVLLQVPTHIVVANAIRYTGADPVYVDCDLNTYNMDLDQAEERVTPRTKALLLQHTFGIPADLDKAQELARRHNLILIEDCVHALGATYQGKQVGTFGKASFFSTEETKIISSTMGGMAVTDDDELAQRIRAFQQKCEWPAPRLAARYLIKLVVYHLLGHPFLHPYTRPIYMKLRQYPSTHLAPGATSHDEMQGKINRDRLPKDYLMRLSNGQAALALRQLKRLDKNLAHRRATAEAYRKAMSKLGFHVPTPPANSEPAFVRYPLWVDDRPDAMRKAGHRVILGQWFNTVLEESTTPESGAYVKGSCPRAEAAAVHLVNVPTHMRVKRQDVHAIAAALQHTPHSMPLPQPPERARRTEEVEAVEEKQA
jgi:perosamine synthetase